MHERSQTAKKLLRGGAALCLSALLVFPALAGTASAAPVTSSLSSAKKLGPVGHTIGIKMFARGVMVIGLSDGSTPAKKCGLRKGNIILKCGDVFVTSAEQFQNLLQQSMGKGISLLVQRDNTRRTLTVKPKKNDSGVYSIGAWVRDSMAGIGTMTFYDPESGMFGALGHGITDPDTAQLMPFSTGSILPSAVKAVKKGKSGEAGELKGNFDLSTDLGELYANTDGGIFGSLSASDFTDKLGEALPIAENSEVKTGKAQILSNVQGDKVKKYQVEITKILSDDTEGRNLLLKVTDSELLKTTGGIVQGMSGSPIIQNGKIVGAVTHVLLNDPTRGYGIMIRNMLENAEPQVAENAS